MEHNSLRLVYRSEHLLNMFCSLYWWRSESCLAWQPSWSLESFCPALLYPFQTSAIMCMWGLRVYQLQWCLIKLAVRVVNKDLSNFFVSCIYLSSTPTEGCDSDPVSLTLQSFSVSRISRSGSENIFLSSITYFKFRRNLFKLLKSVWHTNFQC